MLGLIVASWTCVEVAAVHTRSRTVHATKMVSDIGPKMPRLSLENALGNATSILNAAGVQYVVFYGTALTLHREGHVQEGDDDVDLLIADADVARGVSALREKGIDLQMWDENIGRAGVEVLPPGWAPLEFFVAKDSGGGRRLCDLYCRSQFVSDDVFPAVMRRFYFNGGEHYIPMPRHMDEVLAMLYGPSWVTPTPGSKQDFMVSVKQFCYFWPHCTWRWLMWVLSDRQAPNGLRLSVLLTLLAAGAVVANLVRAYNERRLERSVADAKAVLI